MRRRPTFPNGYKTSWYRQIAAVRGMTFDELVREVKSEHRHIKYLSDPKAANAKDKAWRDANPDKCHAYYKKRWAEDKDAEYARTRKWLLCNPAKRREYRLNYKANNPDAYQQSRKQDYEKHRDTYIKRSGQWSKNNPDKKLHYGNVRRAMKMGAGSVDCSNKIAELRKEKKCHWCSGRITPKNFTVDHVIPLIRGGLHAPENLVAACRSCNCSKNRRLPNEWKPELYKEAA